MNMNTNKSFWGRGGNAQRSEREIVIYISPKQPLPVSPPYELRDYISPDDWAVRVPAIAGLARRYQRPIFEGIWLLLGMLLSLILPFALFNVIWDGMRKDDTLPERQSKFAEARGVSFAVFVGIVLVFWVPLMIWKRIGAHHMKNMLQRWSMQEHLIKGPGVFIPDWKVRMAGIVRDQATIYITRPPTAQASAFHPDAYLPPYIARPADQQGAYHYPYPAHVPGLPRMSTVGSNTWDSKAPIDEKRAFDNYEKA